MVIMCYYPLFIYLRLIKYEIRGDVMKTATFTDADKDLIKEITKYQNSHGLPSFIAAVRKLCKDALQLKKISK